MKVSKQALIKEIKQPTKPFGELYDAVAKETVQLMIFARYLVAEQKGNADFFELLDLLTKLVQQNEKDHPFGEYDGVQDPRLFKQVPYSQEFMKLEVFFKKIDSWNSDEQCASEVLGIESISPQNKQVIIDNIHKARALGLEKRHGISHWHLLIALQKPKEIIECLQAYHIDIDPKSIVKRVLMESHPDMHNISKIVSAYYDGDDSLVDKIKDEIDDISDDALIKEICLAIEAKKIDKTYSWIINLSSLFGVRPFPNMLPNWSVETVPVKDYPLYSERMCFSIDKSSLVQSLQNDTLRYSLSILEDTIKNHLNSGVYIHNNEPNNLASTEFEAHGSWWSRNKDISVFKSSNFSLESAMRGLRIYDLNNPFNSEKSSTTLKNAYKILIKEFTDNPQSIKTYTKIKNKETSLSTPTLKRDYHTLKKKMITAEDSPVPPIVLSILGLKERNITDSFPQLPRTIPPYWLRFDYR